MTTIKKAEIICVGTELLLGQIINTNAAWLARELSLLGIHSYYQTVVGDNPGRLADCIRQAIGRSDMVLLTGGLGPTQDDITMAVAADVAGLPLRLHEPSRAAIAGYFQRLGRRQVTANNWKQAQLPDPCIPLPNNNGTAPGAILTATQTGHNCHLILMPGPPSEMQLMFAESVAPWIRQETTARFRHIFVRMIGIGESSAETELIDLIEQQQNPTLAPYASEGEVVFRITQSLSSDDEPDLTAELLAKVRQRVGAYIYEVGQRTMPEVLRDLLAERHQTISYAESCTGGLATAQLTDFPGASAVLRGSVVAYANQVKTGLLQVDPALIEKSGAVSEACAVAMATGCRDLFQTDWAVAITGIAGPDGGNIDKPVGTVWIAVAGPTGTDSHCLQLGGNRARIRKVAALNAHNLVRRQLSR
jgi:nicotinamide-nucleotide amidase